MLDDLHTVTDPDCYVLLDYFIEQLPEAARLVVITRRDPALKIAQLRSQRGLVELRADELAFTSAEARSLLVDREGPAPRPASGRDALHAHRGMACRARARRDLASQRQRPRSRDSRVRR